MVGLGGYVVRDVGREVVRAGNRNSHHVCSWLMVSGLEKVLLRLSLWDPAAVHRAFMIKIPPG